MNKTTSLEKKIQNIVNLYKSKKFGEAEVLAKQLVKVHPKVVLLHEIIGLIFLVQNKIKDAESIFKKGISINPKYASIYNNLGNICKLQSKFKEAENLYKKSIELNKNSPETHNNLGNLYLKLQKNQEAINSYKNSIKSNLNFFPAYFNLGVLYKNLGEFENAKKYLNETIKLKENYYPAHRAISQIINYSDKNDHYKVLEKVYKESSEKEIKNPELSFAMGKALDDQKKFSNAFKCYSEANALRRKNIVFSHSKEKKEFISIKNFFNNNFFKKIKKNINSSSKPIFVLGMPRSGTTLVEQILSSHQDVYGGDELNILPDLIKKNVLLDSDVFTDKVNISDKILINTAIEYLNYIDEISDGSKRVTDKLPINFKWIGLIKSILPNSKIIHCVRNSKDNCLSIFKNYFVNPNLNFAYDIDEIIYFYNLYFDLMKYWKKLFPNFIYDIKYENLVSDPNHEVMSLLKFTDLSWDNNCLNFYKNKRIIKTASDTQARKKIYKSSINLWKNYNNHFKEFFKKLDN